MQGKPMVTFMSPQIIKNVVDHDARITGGKEVAHLLMHGRAGVGIAEMLIIVIGCEHLRHCVSGRNIGTADQFAVTSNGHVIESGIVSSLSTKHSPSVLMRAWQW